MTEDFTPPRPTDRSMRPYVRSVNHIKPDQLGDVEIDVTDIVDGDPVNGDTIIYNSVTNIFEFGQGGHLSAIEQFDVADDATDVFTLAHIPIDQSWNVDLNGDTLADGVDYTIVARALTVLDPAATFLCADTQGTPWLLQVQYDYRTGGPLPTFGNTAAGNGTSPFTVTFSVAPAAGAAVLMRVQTLFSGSASSVSGLGATWTKVVGSSGGTGSADQRNTDLWLGVGCDGSSTVVTVSGIEATANAIEVPNGLTATGALSNSAVTPDLTAGPLTATAQGVAVYMVNAAGSLTETPASTWTSVVSGFKVLAVDVGDTVQVDAASWAHALVAVIYQ